MARLRPGDTIQDPCNGRLHAKIVRTTVLDESLGYPRGTLAIMGHCGLPYSLADVRATVLDRHNYAEDDEVVFADDWDGVCEQIVCEGLLG